MLTAISGPFVSWGDSPIELNQDAAPSLFARGEGFVDTRLPFQYLGVSTAAPKVYGFPQNGFIQTMNANIYSTYNIDSGAPASVADTPLVLASASVPGLTVGITVREVSTGNFVPNVLALDDFHMVDFLGTPVATSALPLGQSGDIACWDPATLSSRRLVFTGGSVANTFVIFGIDVYGYYMSETLVTTGAGTFFSAKAFKYIISITPSVSDASGMGIIPANRVGLPLRYDYPASTLIYENGVQNTNIADLESSLYTITGITPLAGILTITIADALLSIGTSYTLPVGSSVTLANVLPYSYNSTYTVLTSGPGIFTVASTNVDAYVSGGTVFCDASGPNTNDVRGIYNAVSSPANDYQLVIYQAVSLSNMVSSVGQFGVLQFGG